MKIKLTKPLFDIIYRKILDKCLAENDDFEVQGKGERLYGFGRFSDESTPSIKTIMLESDEVQTCLKEATQENQAKKPLVLNGKYLYDRMREKSSSSPFILLSPFYRDLYLRFIGFDSLSNFLQDGLETDSDHAEIYVAQQQLEKGINPDIPSSEVEYIGYYYTSDNDIRSYKLSVAYNNHLSTNEVDGEATITGLHPQREGRPPEPPLVGTFREIARNLHFDLKNSNNITVSLVLYRSIRQVTDHKLLRGIFLTVSNVKDNFPFTAETLVIRKEDVEGKSGSMDELAIKRYLHMQRNTFLTLPDSILAMPDLKPKGHDLKSMENLVGHYRAWSFYYYHEDDFTKNDKLRKKDKYESKIYQSKFVVYEDYSAFLTSVYGEDDNLLDSKTLPCHIWVTRGKNDQNMACITTFDKHQARVKSHALLEIPKEPNEKYIKGAFAGLGTERRDLLASAVVLQRVSSTESVKAEKVEITQMLKRNSSMKNLLESLAKHYGKVAVNKRGEEGSSFG